MSLVVSEESRIRIFVDSHEIRGLASHLMLKDRQKSILGAAVQDYIDTAKPVASRDLVKRFRLEVSPATVRNEMLALDDMGYLEQPYTSAGRIPTDKGYRFFVDNLMSAFNLSTDEERLIKEVFGRKKEKDFAKELSRTIAHISGTFSAVGLPEEDIFCESGLAELLEEPEFYNPVQHLSLGRLIDSLEEEMENLLTENDIVEKFFIGEENPSHYAGAYTMAVSSWRHPDGFEGFLTMVCPKRTNYSKHKAVMKSINQHYDG